MAVLICLMQVAVLALVPPLIFDISRSATGWRRGFKLAGLIVPVVAVMTGLLFFAVFARADGGNSDTYDQRIVWLYMNPVLLLFIALITAMSVLGRRNYRTLGLWMLAVGAGYFALWFGIGMLNADGGTWWLIPLTALAGALAGCLASFIRTFGTPFRSNWRELVVWTVVTGSSALLGILVAWNLALTSAFRYSWVKPGQMNPGSIGLDLAIVLLIGLGLSALGPSLARYQRPNVLWPVDLTNIQILDEADPPVSLDTSQWETCEIIFQRKAITLAKMGLWFEAAAIGGHGPYVAAQSGYMRDAIQRTGRYIVPKQIASIVTEFNKFIAILSKEGWEAMPERGQFWYSLRFSRRVK